MILRHSFERYDEKNYFTEMYIGYKRLVNLSFAAYYRINNRNESIALHIHKYYLVINTHL